MLFKNRADAGRKLAKKLKRYKKHNRGGVVVLAIPRGGLEVGRVIADELQCPLDCLFSKKIPLPFAEEVAIGAVTLDSFVINEEYAVFAGVSCEYIEGKKKELEKQIRELDAAYHVNAKKIEVTGKTIILTDDGVATGETMEAALEYLKAKKAKKIILAVPVAPPDTWEKLSKLASEAVCLYLPAGFQAVGQFYESFPQLSHEEAKKLLELRAVR